MKELGVGDFKIEELESEVLCTDSTALVSRGKEILSYTRFMVIYTQIPRINRYVKSQNKYIQKLCVLILEYTFPLLFKK
jgi:hypothetical protein